MLRRWCGSSTGSNDTANFISLPSLSLYIYIYMYTCMSWGWQKTILIMLTLPEHEHTHTSGSRSGAPEPLQTQETSRVRTAFHETFAAQRLQTWSPEKERIHPSEADTIRTLRDRRHSGCCLINLNEAEAWQLGRRPRDAFGPPLGISARCLRQPAGAPSFNTGALITTNTFFLRGGWGESLL